MGTFNDFSIDQEPNNDPFDLYQAAIRATNPCSHSEQLRGQMVLLIVRIWAFLPWPLLTVLPLLAGLTNLNFTTTLAASILWMWFLGFLIQNFRLFGPGRKEHQKTVQVPQPKVLVIGAGPTGLAVVKECLAAGLSVRAYERKDTLGGVYHFTENFDGGVWKGCRLTSSSWVTAFSDFPPSTYSDGHPTHDQYHQYLSRYANHFNLLPHLVFHRTVVHLAPHKRGGWNVRVHDAKKLAEKVEHFDFVAICVGSNLKPRGINLPGIEHFKGDIRHVAQYKGPGGLGGKKVVVVGNGESAVDVASEIASIADQTYLSIRRGKFIIPRVNQQSGMANDYDTNRIRYASPVVIRNWYMMLIRRLGYLLRTHDAVSAVGAQMLETSAIGPMSQTATKSDRFIDPFLKGRLKVRREIVTFEQNRVVFCDGVKEEADAVIFAHGYEPSFPFLELSDGVESQHPGLLYLRMFPPQIGKSLAFCGFVRPAIGAIPPTAELQARYFAMIASGRRNLPNENNMRAAVKAQLRENVESFPMQPHPNLLVSWIRYMDQIAEEIGCRPNPWALLQDPTLMWKVMTGPVTGAIYRLHGPGAHAVARRTILRLQGTHPVREMMTHLGLHFWLWPLALLHKKTYWKQHNTFI